MLPTNPSIPEIWYTYQEQGFLAEVEGVRTIYPPTEKMQFRPKGESKGKRLEHIYKTSLFLKQDPRNAQVRTLIMVSGVYGLVTTMHIRRKQMKTWDEPLDMEDFDIRSDFQGIPYRET